MKKILILFILLIFPYTTTLSNTYFYKITKISREGKIETNVNGGQFFTFTDNACYESDKDGISVDNGVCRYKRRENNVMVYVGECYYGSAIIMVKQDYSKINIVHKETTYVYERATPPAHQTTCSLIRKKSSGSSQYIPDTNPNSNYQWYGNYYNTPNTTKDNNTTTTKPQKTKVRNKCAYCSGKGEVIQTKYEATFGTYGPPVYCKVCNRSWSYGTVHIHLKCSHCHGVGYTEYEY